MFGTVLLGFLQLGLALQSQGGETSLVWWGNGLACDSMGADVAFNLPQDKVELPAVSSPKKRT